jgi:hypothetical protein
MLSIFVLNTEKYNKYKPNICSYAKYDKQDVMKNNYIFYLKEIKF